MRSRAGLFMRGIAAAFLLLASAAIVAAQSTADFYKNRNVDLYVGFSPGGAYDFYARAISRHMGAHIPVIRLLSRATWKAPAVCGSPIGSIASRRATARSLPPSGAASRSIRC